MIWTREETTIGHHKRHACTIKNRWGADAEGNLIAQEIDVLADAGAYTSSTPYVLASMLIHATGPYEVPNVWVDARACYTNNLPAGAFLELTYRARVAVRLWRTPGGACRRGAYRPDGRGPGRRPGRNAQPQRRDRVIDLQHDVPAAARSERACNARSRRAGGWMEKERERLVA